MPSTKAFFDVILLASGGIAVLSGVNALRQTPRREWWLRTLLAATSTTAIVLVARKSIADSQSPSARRRIGPGVRRVWRS